MREIEWEIVPGGAGRRAGLLPWSPLGGGWLSGKYRRDQRPTGDTRLGDNPRPRHGGLGPARHRAHLEHHRRRAEGRRGRAASRWPRSRSPGCTDRPAVTSTILGARTLDQLDANLKAADLHLDDAEVAALDEASDLHAADYPYGEMGIAQRDRTLRGGR